MTVIAVFRLARTRVDSVWVGINGCTLQAIIKVIIDIEQATFGNLAVQDIDLEGAEPGAPRPSHQVTDQVVTVTARCAEYPVIQRDEHRL